MKDKKTTLGMIVLCAGGSGGHIFPAEALATKLIVKGYDVTLLTDKRGLAFKADPHIKIIHINGKAVTGCKTLEKMVGLFSLFTGVLQSIFILHKIQPLAVVGFGGFASIPGCVAAMILRFPLVLHEQNAVLGRANRLLAKRADLLVTSFKKVLKVPKALKTVYVGMPVRDGIAKKAAAPYPNITAKSEINILVMGGSQGARVLSEIVPNAMAQLPLALRNRLKIFQQCRKEDLEAATLVYKKHKIKAELKPFFDDVPVKMAKSHLIISRSGASSMAEILSIGRPAILVPLKSAADNHQYFNALALKETGGGWIILQDAFTPLALAERLESLLVNPFLLKKAASCALIKDTAGIADKLANTVIGIIKESNKK